MLASFYRQRETLTIPPARRPLIFIFPFPCAGYWGQTWGGEKQNGLGAAWELLLLITMYVTGASVFSRTVFCPSGQSSASTYSSFSAVYPFKKASTPFLDFSERLSRPVITTLFFGTLPGDHCCKAQACRAEPTACVLIVM